MEVASKVNFIPRHPNSYILEYFFPLFGQTPANLINFFIVWAKTCKFYSFSGAPKNSTILLQLKMVLGQFIRFSGPRGNVRVKASVFFWAPEPMLWACFFSRRCLSMQTVLVGASMHPRLMAWLRLGVPISFGDT